MTRQIILENGVAKVIEVNVVAEAPIDAISKHLVTYRPTAFPACPSDLSAIVYDQNTNVGALAVQRVPTMVPINVHYDVANRGAVQEDYDRRDPATDTAVYHISLPYLQFIFNFRLQTTGNDWQDGAMPFAIDKARVFWTRDPIRSLLDPVLPAKIPNVRTDGDICWGYTRHDTTSLSARIDHMVKAFYVTTFNNHLGMLRPEGIDSYVKWEELSQRDPFAWRTWQEWDGLPHAQAIGDILEAPPNATVLNGANDAIIDLPEPPPLFTVGKAKEWAKRLDPQLGRVLLVAVKQVLEEAPEEGTLITGQVR